MNTRTKYYFIMKSTFIVFMINIILGFGLRTLEKFSIDNVYVAIGVDIIKIARGFILVYIIFAILLLSYFIILYLTTPFYKAYKINPVEAIYYGVMDMHVIYTNLLNTREIKELDIDFKKQIIYFSTKDKHFSVIYQDLFGVYNGKEDSEYWSKLSKRKKEYGRSTYTKRVNFPNPYRVNQTFAKKLKEIKEVDYQTYTVLSGLYKMQYKSDSILAPYEVADILDY